MYPVLVCKLVLGDAVDPVIVLAVDGVAEYHEVVAVLRVCERLLHVGELAAAGCAPAGPEVDEDVLATQV